MITCKQIKCLNEKDKFLKTYELTKWIHGRKSEQAYKTYRDLISNQKPGNIEKPTTKQLHW